MQADGRRLSRIDFDGWQRLTELIRSECSPIVQFGSRCVVRPLTTNPLFALGLKSMLLA